MRAGFLMRTPKGRVATEACYRHLGIIKPATLAAELNPGLFDEQ